MRTGTIDFSGHRMPHFWADEPLKSTKNDNFGRSDFARDVANFISSIPSATGSIVVATPGLWGSGKTSVAHMIEESLSKESGYGWSIAWYTPWASSDYNSMLEQFVATLVDASPSNSQKRLARKFAPWLDTAETVLRLAPQTRHFAENWSRAREERTARQPWTKTIAEIEREIELTNRKFLVIVDDLDRLESDELLQTLKLIRVLGRIRNVHYLLLFDEGALQELLPDRGIYSFIDKFVQYSFPVPPLNEFAVANACREGIEQKGFSHLYSNELERYELQSLYDSAFKLLLTPRSIERFLQQLYYRLSKVDPREIRVSDLTVLTLIQTTVPAVFERLPSYKSTLVADKRRPAFDKSKQEKDLWDPTPLLDGVEPKLRAPVIALLHHLFPNISPKGCDQTKTRSVRRWYERSIGTKEYFDRYFTNYVPSGDVPDSDVLEKIAEMSETLGKSHLLLDLLSLYGRDRVIPKALRFKPRGSDQALTLAFNLLETFEGMHSDDHEIFFWTMRVMSMVDAQGVTLGNDHFDILARVPKSIQTTLAFHCAENLENEVNRQILEWSGERRLDSVLTTLSMDSMKPYSSDIYNDAVIASESGLLLDALKQRGYGKETKADEIFKIAGLFVTTSPAFHENEHREIAGWDNDSFLRIAVPLELSITDLEVELSKQDNLKPTQPIVATWNARKDFARIKVISLEEK